MALLNSEMGSHRDPILCTSCFSSPYESFEWMRTSITWFPREMCSPLTWGPSGPSLLGKAESLNWNFMHIVFL